MTTYGVVEGKIGALNAESVTATPARPYWFMVVDALLPAGTRLALTVNRLATLPPYRRPMLTPLSDGFWQ